MFFHEGATILRATHHHNIKGDTASIAEDDGAGSGNTMVSQDSWIKSKAWAGVTGRVQAAGIS